MGSGRGSEGTRCSRYLPRALLTATRHKLSKVLGIPGECEERSLFYSSSKGPELTTVDTTALTQQLPNLRDKKALEARKALLSASI